MIPFELIEPSSVAQAIALLDPNDISVRPIAGGSAVMLMMKAGVLRPRCLVSLRKVPGLGGIAQQPDGSLRFGAMTTLGGIGHTLPFLIKDFPLALGIAIAVVLVELGVITWVRHRYMDTPTFSAALQVGLGGALVFITGILIGRS